MWPATVVNEVVRMAVEGDGYWQGQIAHTAALAALAQAGPDTWWHAVADPIVHDWENNPGHALGGTAVTVATFVIPGGAALKGARAAKMAEESTMAGVRAAGATGEQLAGIAKNSEHIPSASGTAAYRIPDELNASVLGEVKSVSRLSYTNQLRDFSAYASANGLQFNLYVRGGTQLSGPLQEAVNSGAINLVRNLP